MKLSALSEMDSCQRSAVAANVPRAQARSAGAGVKRKGRYDSKSDESEVAKSGKRGKAARPAQVPFDTQQFLPIGMMMAALAMSKGKEGKRRGEKRQGGERR